VELILVLLPFALLFAGIALALFVWAARSGQFDDLETPAVRILFDDDKPAPTAPGGVGNGRAAPSGDAPGAGEPDKERP
jgi:cbb3-type cytochrome oxidase maturation protein